MRPDQHTRTEFGEWWKEMSREWAFAILPATDQRLIRSYAELAWLESRIVAARRELAALAPADLPLVSTAKET